MQLLKKLGINAQIGPIADEAWDIIVECTGNPEGLTSALKKIKPRGTIILKSTYANQTVINQNLIVVKEITLTGSRCGNFSLAIELLRKGIIHVKPLVTKIMPIEKYQEAFALAQHPDSLKVILKTCLK